MRNNEVVAIKKMSYSGKQTNEVTEHDAGESHKSEPPLTQFDVLCCCAEVAGHHQRSKVPAETSPSKHHRVSRVLFEGTHSMGMISALILTASHKEKNSILLLYVTARVTTCFSSVEIKQIPMGGDKSKP